MAENRRVRKGKVPHAIMNLNTCSTLEQSSIAQTISRVEEMSVVGIKSEISELQTQAEDKESFEVCLICILHLKRCGKRSPRITEKTRILTDAVQLESKAFFEDFLSLSLKDKATIASEIVKENVFLTLEHATMMSLLDYGLDVSETSISYNLGLQVWEGTWLHYLASEGLVLNRAWFSDVDSKCVCKSEALEESVLDQVLSTDSARQDVKFYNAMICLALGYNPSNVDMDLSCLQYLQFAIENVRNFEFCARQALESRFKRDLASLVFDYYQSDWAQISQFFKQLQASPADPLPNYNERCEEFQC